MGIFDNRLIPRNWDYVRVERGLTKRATQRITKDLRAKYGRNVKIRKDPNGRYEVWAADYYKIKSK